MPRRNIDDSRRVTLFVGLEELDGGGMPRRRSESTIPCHQGSSEFLGQHNIGSIVGRNVVAQLPNSWQEHEMRIPGNPKIQQIVDRLVGANVRGPPPATRDAGVPA